MGAVAVILTEESHQDLRRFARHPVVHGNRILLEQDPTSDDFLLRYKRIIGYCHSISIIPSLMDAQNQAVLVRVPPHVEHDERPLFIALSSTHGREEDVGRFVQEVSQHKRLATRTDLDDLLLVGTIHFLSR
jgi:hypothetical protein